MVLLATGCSTPLRHPEFIEANTEQLRRGLELEEVAQLFGLPDDEIATLCGTATEEPWPCLVWRYRLGRGNLNILLFDRQVEPPTLDSWLLGRVWDEGVPERAIHRLE